MKSSSRLTALIIFCCCAAFALPALWARVETRTRAQGPSAPAQAREEAYRANNLGVALLEQFKHKEGADEFRRALGLDPRLALARINLAIALFNVPDAAGAQREAQAAAAASPDAPQPHYILGLIAKAQGRADDAVAAFQRVLKIDPRDVGANVNLGQLYAQQRKYAEAVAAFRTALAEEPYNGTALYNLGTALLRAGQREEGQRMMQQFQALRQSGAATVVGQNYLEQGRYAEAVASTGAEADVVNKAIPEVSFSDATASALPDLSGGARASGAQSPGETAPAGKNEMYAVRVRASPPRDDTLFDFDGDGDLDLFGTVGAAHRLYRNDGGKFTDVTAQSGALARETKGGGFAAVAGDFDNDEKPDLFTLRVGSMSLYRNEGGGRFADVTAAAKLPSYPYLTASASFVDADHDGDLDIFVAGLADLSKPASSVKAGEGELSLEGLKGAPNLLLRNNGNGTFADVTSTAKVTGGGRAVAVVPTDYDNRRDVDLLVVNHDSAPQLYRNLRDGTFRDVAAEVGLGVKGRFACAAAGDVNKDEFTDFFFGAEDAPGLFAVSDGRGRFTTSTAPAATAGASAAQFLDYDNDGLLDLVALTTAGLRVLRNVGDGWADVSQRAAERALAGGARTPGQVAARSFTSADADGDGDTDLFVRGADGRLKFLRNDGGNRNRSVRVQLAGKVSNRSGVGAKVELRAGSLRQKLETYAVSPAPAPADVVFGIGQRAATDAVRVLWPAGIVQAETNIGATASHAADAKATQAPAAVKTTITELDRKPSSCPYLYAWNGERFEFITDFMGGGELGYWVAPGVRAAPDPDEYVRIRGDQLKERGGRLELRVTNELEEVLYLDALRLVAVAHPEGTEVYPGEGLGSPLASTLKLFTTRGARPPAAARDDHGHDVLARVSAMDRQYPDDFKLHRIRGYAEEHGLTLDLGSREGGRVRSEPFERKGDGPLIPHPSSLIPPARTLLLLTGWTDYAFSSDNVAASQSGMSLRPPALQVKDARGRWRTVIENIGIPVGRPQTVVVDLTGKFLSASREVRILTNMRIYWDQVLVDTSGNNASLRTTTLRPAVADLRWRGFSAEATPDAREPFGYDYARVTFTSPWKVMPGRYTREGDVRPLVGASDDMFVVSRPGDELALSFDAAKLPPLARGWTRTFLLYADGFSKEMDINSASPDVVAPLPFHGMKNYPYSAPERYPSTPAHRAYVERYNTRVVAAPVSRIEAAYAYER